MLQTMFSYHHSPVEIKAWRKDESTGWEHEATEGGYKPTVLLSQKVLQSHNPYIPSFDLYIRTNSTYPQIHPTRRFTPFSMPRYQLSPL